MPRIMAKTGYYPPIKESICHGSVSAGDALGREHPVTPMLSYFTGHSRCKVT